jgi:hypothetical protein
MWHGPAAIMWHGSAAVVWHGSAAIIWQGFAAIVWLGSAGRTCAIELHCVLSRVRSIASLAANQQTADRRDLATVEPRSTPWSCIGVAAPAPSSEAGWLRPQKPRQSGILRLKGNKLPADSGGRLRHARASSRLVHPAGSRI